MSFLISPNEAQMEYIKKDELYRSPAELEEDITQLIEWLSKQPHLPNVPDRKWLLHFMIGCKYSLQKSKKVIESYFIARANYPEYYGSFTEDEIKEAVKQGTISVCPKLTPEGYRVVIIKSVPMANDYKFDVSTFVKAVTMMQDVAMKVEPMYGNVYVYDLKHFRMSDFMAFTPTVTKNMNKCFIDSSPMRLKSVHYVNPPIFVSTVVAFFKMFLSQKLKERFFVHDSVESLYQYVPKEILPDTYGGFDGTIETNEKNAIQLIFRNKEWLDKLPKADLSKQPKQTKSDDLGVNGTFKKLQID